MYLNISESKDQQFCEISAFMLWSLILFLFVSLQFGPAAELCFDFKKESADTGSKMETSGLKVFQKCSFFSPVCTGE